MKMEAKRIHLGSQTLSEPVAKTRKFRFIFRFSLLTLLMLITTAVVLIEKPVRKMINKRKLAEEPRQKVYPPDLKWSESTGPWFLNFLPESWQSETDKQDITTVRLWLTQSFPLGQEEADIAKKINDRVEKEKKLIELILKHPDATEDVDTILIRHEIDPRMESWITSRRNLRVLQLSNRGKQLNNSFLEKLSTLPLLEVLTLSKIEPDQIAILQKMKRLRWLQVDIETNETMAAIRQALPNTYVN